MNKLKGLIYVLTFIWLVILFYVGAFSISQIGRDRDFKMDRMEPAIQFIDNYKNQKHKLPTRQEFKNFYEDAEFVDYQPSKYGDYEIRIWRGEWNETYSSRTKTFSNPPNERAWLIEGLTFIIIGCLPLLLFHLFIRKYFKSTE